jgi:hypothetical protein
MTAVSTITFTTEDVIRELIIQAGMPEAQAMKDCASMKWFDDSGNFDTHSVTMTDDSENAPASSAIPAGQAIRFRGAR